MCSIFGFCGSRGEYDEIQKALLATKSRGPDDSRIINTGNGWIGFNRLSIMGLTENGMYLVCKAIHDESDLRVILTGEISDEIFGYKYTDFAPSAEEFQKEAEKRIHEIHMYDVLRADRCISVHSLEARVSFGDLAFVDFWMPNRNWEGCDVSDPSARVLSNYGESGT